MYDACQSSLHGNTPVHVYVHNDLKVAIIVLCS